MKIIILIIPLLFIGCSDGKNSEPRILYENNYTNITTKTVIINYYPEAQLITYSNEKLSPEEQCLRDYPDFKIKKITLLESKMTLGGLKKYTYEVVLVK